MQLYQFQFKAMGSPCGVHIYADSKSEAERTVLLAKQEAERLEAKYSRYRSNSLLSIINSNAGKSSVAIDHETVALLSYADQAFQISDGLFDITTGVLRQAWDFKIGIVPKTKVIERWQALVNWRQVQWDDKSIFLTKADMQIDFGGIVKEYASDAIAGQLKQHGIQYGLVDMGGDIHVIGPHQPGQPWVVGIQDPNSEINLESSSQESSSTTTKAIANIAMTCGGLASSGDYQRCIVLNGKKYSHLLNPKTGWPVAGLAAVSVCSEQCVMAGTIATIAMLKEQQGIAWLQELEVPFVAVDQQGLVYKNL